MNIASLLLGLLALQNSGDAPKDSGKPAAKCVSVSGLLLEKQTGGTWKPVNAGESLPSGSLLVGMPHVDLVSPSGAVQVRLLADTGQRGPFPVLEAGVILHDPAGVDIDLTPARGLIVFDNLLKEGQAKVRLRFQGETWTLHLQTPGTKVGMEIFGRHAPGLIKTIDDKSDVPTLDVLLLVLKGQAFLESGTEGTGMHAPPGLARMHWDNLSRRPSFQRLEQLPETIVKPLDDREEKTSKALAAAMGKLAQGDLGKGLDNLLQSEQKLERLAGITMAGAVDDLPRIFGVLMTSKDTATRDFAIVALRHWLGREPGQLKKMHAAMLATNNVNDIQARNLIHLLVGFNEEERADPDTYDLLLTYLDYQGQAVRTLAHWHLVRLAPGGKDFGFDAAAPEEQRRQAVQRWHALIPDGQLPPRPKTSAP
jgi:hypothetical protein